MAKSSAIKKQIELNQVESLIDSKREALNQLAHSRSYNLQDREILNLSQDIDSLIIQYYKLKKGNE